MASRTSFAAISVLGNADMASFTVVKSCLESVKDLRSGSFTGRKSTFDTNAGTEAGAQGGAFCGKLLLCHFKMGKTVRSRYLSSPTGRAT